MVAGRPARELSRRRGPPAASMGRREDPAPGAERGSCGAGPGGRREGTRAGTDGVAPARLSGTRAGDAEVTGTRPLDGGDPDRARLAAAAGALGGARRPGAHGRAWLSPSSLRARPREGSPPRSPAPAPAPPSGPTSLRTTQPNPRPPLGRSDWHRARREAELSLSGPRLPNDSTNWKFRAHRGPGPGVDWLPRRSLRKLLWGILARLVEAADPHPPFPGNHVVEAGPGRARVGTLPGPCGSSGAEWGAPRPGGRVSGTRRRIPFRLLMIPHTDLCSSPF